MPLTAEGRVVLVRLTYAPGWRLPGGGRKRGEAPVEAMLRELREEIGLLGHGEIEALDVARLGGDSDDRSALFLVRDVRYRPRRSLEIDEVREFNPDRLPDEAAAWTRRIVDGLGGLRPPRGAGADG